MPRNSALLLRVKLCDDGIAANSIDYGLLRAANGFAGERAGKREVQPISELTRLYEYLQLARSCITCIPNQTLQRTASRKTGFIPSEWPGGGAAARRLRWPSCGRPTGWRTDGRTRQRREGGGRACRRQGIRSDGRSIMEGTKEDERVSFG